MTLTNKQIDRIPTTNMLRVVIEEVPMDTWNDSDDDDLRNIHETLKGMLKRHKKELNA